MRYLGFFIFFFNLVAPSEFLAQDWDRAVFPLFREVETHQVRGGWPPQQLHKKARVIPMDLGAAAVEEAGGSSGESRAIQLPEAPPPETLAPIDPPTEAPLISPPPAPREESAPASPPDPPKSSVFTLGPGDAVTFSLFDRGDLKRTVTIAPDGTLSYLQAVGIEADGLTVDQLRSRMEEALRDYRQDARLIVTPVGIGSKQFSIIGRVRKPGSFVLDRPTTVLEGIARAEGVEVGTVRGSAFGLADFGRSFVSRGGRKLDIDLARLYQQGDLSQNAFLQPDDYLYVASVLENECYVLGAVGRPGRIKMPNRLTVARAIAEAGGFADGAFRTRVLILRGGIHSPETREANLKEILKGRALDVPIANGDIIFVAKHPFEMVENALEVAIFTYMQTVTAEVLNQNYNPISL